MDIIIGIVSDEFSQKVSEVRKRLADNRVYNFFKECEEIVIVAKVSSFEEATTIRQQWASEFKECRFCKRAFLC